jgi:hypothetical protein
MRLSADPPTAASAGSAMVKAAGHKARLIAEVAAAPVPVAVADTPETRLERVAQEPAALIALLQGGAPAGPAPDGVHGRQAHIRSRIFAALAAPARQAYAEEAREGAATRRERVRVLRELKATAPAVAAGPAAGSAPPEAAAPFTPSAEDVAQSIDGGRRVFPPFSAFRDFVFGPKVAGDGANALPVLALLAGLAMTFTFWLLI